jgi:dipeptidyl-peptidase 4
VADTFPRQYARTQRLTLGEPRNVVVSADGRRATFLRSRAGDDPVTCLWTVDLTTHHEVLVADPRTLLDHDADDLPPAERARRERLREGAGGITAFATDDAGSVAAFTVAGRLFVAGLVSGRARPLDVPGPVFDPRPDPTATRVAYVTGNAVVVAELDGRTMVIAGSDGDPDTVSWGSADFIAAEEMRRMRGYWWSPDGTRLAVARVDVAPVGVWHLADPADPTRDPVAMRYPAAGTPNADTTLHLFDLGGGEPVDVEWDRQALPYLADVHWGAHGLLLTVQSRDQRDLAVVRVETTTGATETATSDHDAAWVELVPGTPAVLGDGRIVTCADRDGARRLVVDGDPVTPVDLQVRSVASVSAGTVVFHANPIDDPTVQHVWRWTAASLEPISTGPGVHTAHGRPEALVLRTATLEDDRASWCLPDGHRLDSYAEVALVTPRVQIHHSAVRRLATALCLPHDHDGSPLPVLLDPYGGPHAQRVVRSRNAFASSQWFADQGFAVVVADGRGTPGRGTDFERAVHLDLATAPLDDQIEALHHVADATGMLDLERVAIRGWSFGGYLAALAVLRRPDVFHAAIAGAPVTEWRLYDTHYTERYLGDPFVDATPYDASSLLPLAPALTRPLLLVHGLADDNVVAAHTLQLSAALLAAGRPHEVLPLVGVTHMTPQEVVAEHLLLHQLDFLRRALGLATVPPWRSDDG